MPLIIIISIVTVSLLLSVFFILRDAKSFALAPPTPLIDLDRMYDYIFSNLDEEAIAEAIGLLRPGKKVLTGAALDDMDDEELKKIIEDFVELFSKNELISDNLISQNPAIGDIKFTPDHIATAIKNQDLDLDVRAIEIKKVVTLALSYLSDIGALI